MLVLAFAFLVLFGGDGCPPDSINEDFRRIVLAIE